MQVGFECPEALMSRITAIIFCCCPRPDDLVASNFIQSLCDDRFFPLRTA